MLGPDFTVFAVPIRRLFFCFVFMLFVIVVQNCWDGHTSLLLCLACLFLCVFRRSHRSNIFLSHFVWCYFKLYIVTLLSISLQWFCCSLLLHFRFWRFQTFSALTFYIKIVSFLSLRTPTHWNPGRYILTCQVYLPVDAEFVRFVIQSADLAAGGMLPQWVRGIGGSMYSGSIPIFSFISRSQFVSILRTEALHSWFVVLLSKLEFYHLSWAVSMLRYIYH